MSFNIIQVLLIVLTVIVLSLPLWRKQKLRIGSNHTNLAIYKTQVEELDYALKENNIDETQYEESINDLQTSLGANFDNSATYARRFNPFLTGFFITVTVVVISTLVGVKIEGSKVGEPQPADKAQSLAKNVPKLIKELENRLRKEPNNPEGWGILARTYQATGRTKNSVTAYRQAVKYNPDNAHLMTQLGYAIATLNNGDFSGEPIELFRKAQKINPENQDSAYLIGRYYFQKGNYQQAINTWQELLPKLNSSDVVEVRNDIEVAQEKSVIKQQDVPRKSITVNISISPKVVAKVSPDSYVFVSAHALNGPPMPLAAVKLTASELPKQITLDKSKAVITGLNIDKFDKFKIKAKISKSGSATPRADDMSSVIELIDITEEIDLIIGQD